MSTYNFTVTEIVYGFTATIATPVELTLTETPDQISVINALTTVTTTSTVQQIIVTGAGSGQSFNQSLNTTDDVTFASVTTHAVYGMSPVTFPTGIDITNTGITFIGDIDLAGVYQQFTNQLGLLFALLPLDFGSINNQSTFSVDIGHI